MLWHHSYLYVRFSFGVASIKSQDYKSYIYSRMIQSQLLPPWPKIGRIECFRSQYLVYHPVLEGDIYDQFYWGLPIFGPGGGVYVLDHPAYDIMLCYAIMLWFYWLIGLFDFFWNRHPCIVFQLKGQLIHRQFLFSNYCVKCQIGNCDSTQSVKLNI